MHKDAFSSSFKSILRAGDFDIEETRVRRSDDSGVVDDVTPEAPSPSSTISSSSSSSNLSASLPADSCKPTTTSDNKPAKPSRNVSGEKTQPEEDRKSGDVSGTANPETKCSVISTPFNVVENSSGSTPMSLAVRSGARSQLTRNIVVVVKSTSSVVTEDDAETLRNAVPGSGQAEEPKNTPLQSATLTPALTSVGGTTLIQVASATSDSTSPYKPALANNSKRRQQSVDPERRVTQNKGLRRMESSPSNLAAALSAAAVPTVKETFPQVSSSNDGGIVNVVPSSGPNVVPSSVPSVMRITPLPSTPITSTSNHVPLVASRAYTGTSLAGPTSRLAVHVPEQSERVSSSRISDKAAAAAAVRQRHRSTPVDISLANNTSRSVTSGDTTRKKQAAVSSDSSSCDNPNHKTPQLKTDLTDGEHMSKMSPTTQCQRLPNASPSVRRIIPSTANTDATKNVVIGRLKRISPRDERMTPVSSSCLVSEKVGQRPTQLGITSQVPQSTPQLGEHTGPVISDPFESLRRRQEQEAAAAAAALSQVAKIPTTVAPGVCKSRQRRIRSARPKTGRSSVVSVTVRTRPPLSRQPSAATIRHRKLKTPTSAANSTVGMNAKTPRGTKDRKDRACRVRRRRSRSNVRKDELDVVADASDVTMTGRTGWQTGTKCDDVKGVCGVAKRRNYETTKTDKTEELKTRERSQSSRRSRISHVRTRSFGSSERDDDPTESGKDGVFTREVGAAKAEMAAVGKHKRSTSSGEAEHRDSTLTDEVPKDQQGCCKCLVPGPSSRLSRDGKPSCRLCSRRQSQSLSPICSGNVSAVPSVDATEIQHSTAAADEPHSDQPDRSLLTRQSAKLPVSSSQFHRTQDAELSAAIDEIMRSRPSRRSSRRSRPADRGGDAVGERGGRNQDDHDCMAPSNMPPAFANQETTAKPPLASTTSDVGSEIVEDADADKDVDLSPRFVRKHDSIVAMSSTAASDVSSRRTSVDKVHGGLGTLEDDATLSWHNSFFDNTAATANDTVSEAGSLNLSGSLFYYLKHDCLLVYIILLLLLLLLFTQQTIYSNKYCYVGYVSLISPVVL